ncbi:MAG: ribonuclease Y [Bacteroidetes bacterium]|nr:ribonuclease Y [Bacteroidota bacterium]MBU1114993.1 ribonuclease Y [Bacteroidota bacterium]MBU1797523.1 ribonuclease Y [Bacteroidota bacterium]
MLDPVIILSISVVLIVLAFVLGWVINSKIGKNNIIIAEEKSKKILEDADKDAKNLKREKILEVKDEWYKKKQEFDAEANTKKQKFANIESKLEKREENLDRKYDLVLAKEKEIKSIESQIERKLEQLKTKEKEVEQLVFEQNIKLEKIASLTAEEAKKMLMDNMINKAKSEAIQQIQQIRDEAMVEAKKNAQKIIVQSIQRTAVDHSVESTVSVVQIQNDEMKGRIIGREGRNIRAFEAATGVDVIVDDTPEAVILSAFDQFRREVARISLEKLIADGRIHPARIEEVVKKVQAELEEEIYKEGENTLIQLGIHGVHREIIKLIGRMKFRSSYGQNLLQHSIEVAHITGFMAAELGFDQAIAKRAGLLHDIGKTVDKSIEGPHALLGYDVAKRYKEHPIVINAIGSHHEDIEMEHPISALVQAADAISGARPGARREPLESYVKRLENLESLATSFEGVEKTYAIQAGREIRVVVEPEKADDDFSSRLAFDIAKKIEEEMEYPGQIKVTVIREVRKIAYAK